MRIKTKPMYANDGENDMRENKWEKCGVTKVMRTNSDNFIEDSLD